MKDKELLQSPYLFWPPSQNHHYGTLITSTTITHPDPLDYPSLEVASDHHDDETMITPGEEIVDTFFTAECFDKDNRNQMQPRVTDSQDQEAVTWSPHCSQDIFRDYFL